MNIVVSAIIALTIMGAGLIHGRYMAHEAFINECVNDGRKHYECEVMWGESRP